MFARSPLAGYSLGGNLTLKLAGELGDTFPALKAVCAVSPTMDLAACVKALERRSNIAYEFNFVRRLKARMRRKAAIFPQRLFARAARSRVDGAAVRRGLHGAAPRVPRRERLLLSRQRDAGHRSHPRAGADHDRGGRPVRPRRSVSRVVSAEQPEREGRGHAARRTLRVRRDAATASTTAIGRSARSSGS